MTVFCPSVIEKILDFSEDALMSARVPGAVVALVEGDETLCLKTFGTGVSPHTLFPIASLTKSYTAASIALLVEQGLLQWKDSVLKHIPHFCFYNDTVTRSMEIHDLLTHRTGLYAGCLEQMALWGYERQALQRGIQHVKPISPFRRTYAYNNVPYLWVEDLFLCLTGKPWAHFVVENMLGPLGLRQTHVGKKAFDHGHLAQGYILDEETRTQLHPISFSNYAETFLTAGGLVASGGDVAQWVKVLLGTIPFLSDESRKSLTTPYTPIDENFSYCLGLRMRHGFPHPIFSHGGLIQGIRHQMLFIPNLKVGIVVLTNLTHSSATSQVLDYFCQTLMGTYEKVQKPTLFPVKTWLNPLYGGVGGNINGVYHNPILGTICIENATLTLLETGAQASLSPISPHTFSIYFQGAAGEFLGEGHWGMLNKRGKTLFMKAHENFSFEKFFLFPTN
jgi:CubicO group peptidase (beta-lactamase class C family)